jgi:zinc transport system ATP-binding protein
MEQKNIVSCINAAFGYGGKAVVSGLDFTIEEGDYLCIVGENGSGKSTLVKGILSLIHPISGSITIDKSISENGIGYLPQQQEQKKDFPASVWEVVLSGCAGKMGLRPFYSQKEKDDAEKNLHRLDICDLKNKAYSELSGGQQRRVLLARSLCASQKLLVLDEPFAGLDPLISQDVHNLLKKIQAETGITIIMVSHDINAVSRYADKVLHLQNKQLFFGKTLDYMSHSAGETFREAAR